MRSSDAIVRRPKVLRLLINLLSSIQGATVDAVLVAVALQLFKLMRPGLSRLLGRLFRRLSSVVGLQKMDAPTSEWAMLGEEHSCEALDAGSNSDVGSASWSLTPAALDRAAANSISAEILSPRRPGHRASRPAPCPPRVSPMLCPGAQEFRPSLVQPHDNAVARLAAAFRPLQPAGSAQTAARQDTVPAPATDHEAIRFAAAVEPRQRQAPAKVAAGARCDEREIAPGAAGEAERMADIEEAHTVAVVEGAAERQQAGAVHSRASEGEELAFGAGPTATPPAIHRGRAADADAPGEAAAVAAPAAEAARPVPTPGEETRAREEARVLAKEMSLLESALREESSLLGKARSREAKLQSAAAAAAAERDDVERALGSRGDEVKELQVTVSGLQAELELQLHVGAAIQAQLLSEGERVGALEARVAEDAERRTEAYAAAGDAFELAVGEAVQAAVTADLVAAGCAIRAVAAAVMAMRQGGADEARLAGRAIGHAILDLAQAAAAPAAAAAGERVQGTALSSPSVAGVDAVDVTDARPGAQNQEAAVVEAVRAAEQASRRMVTEAVAEAQTKARLGSELAVAEAVARAERESVAVRARAVAEAVARAKAEGEEQAARLREEVSGRACAEAAALQASLHAVRQRAAELQLQLAERCDVASRQRAAARAAEAGRDVAERRRTEAIAHAEALQEELAGVREALRSLAGERQAEVAAAAEAAGMAELARRAAAAVHSDRESALQARDAALTALAHKAELSAGDMRSDLAAAHVETARARAETEAARVEAEAAIAAAEAAMAEAHSARAEAEAAKASAEAQADEARSAATAAAGDAAAAMEREGWWRAQLQQHIASAAGALAEEEVATARSASSVAAHPVRTSVGLKRLCCAKCESSEARTGGQSCAAGLHGAGGEVGDRAPAVEAAEKVAHPDVSPAGAAQESHPPLMAQNGAGFPCCGVHDGQMRTPSPAAARPPRATTPQAWPLDRRPSASKAWSGACASPVALHRRPSRSPVWQAARWAEAAEPAWPWRGQPSTWRRMKALAGAHEAIGWGEA